MVRTKGAARARLRRENKMYNEIIRLQNSSSNIMPKAPFCRIVKEILGEHGGFRITTVALTALQESCELYLTHLFSDAYLLTYHRKRVTLNVADVQLVSYIRSHSVT